ncbi:MAG: 2-C-methyl-D-erythritol 4-phosphate cytidylyltransferase [Lachnospiraceae bacterium]|nr:2-C-methyl-D-erythritol 4-phosphate cytidylyltransferase [Lachnospiraceae bacterium]
MNYALLLSGGKGTRTESNIPKQYVKAGGHMMITYALYTLLGNEHIDSVYIIAEQEWRDEILSDIKGYCNNFSKIEGFVKPGSNRQESILNGLMTIVDLSDSKDDTVIIHDAARPYLSNELLDNCYKDLAEYDGVLPVLPVKDTVYVSKDGKFISELIDRRTLYAGQSPELFRLKSYYDANMALLPDRIFDINGSTEPAILNKMNIVMIQGDENNTKVTTTKDLERFKEIINESMDA